MKKSVPVLCCILVALWLFPVVSSAGEKELIDSLVTLRLAGKPLPLISAKISGLDVKGAYALQKKFTEALAAKGLNVGGFKAALTSPAGQKKFGVKTPQLGPLFKQGRLDTGATVERKGFTRLFLENEVGYIVGKKISKPVKDVAELKGMISEVFPAVEMPDLRFAQLKGLKIADLIVDTMASSKYIVGKRVPADKIDLNKVVVKMTRDGETVNEGKATDVMGDQWKACLWLVNNVVKQGWTIEPGYVLITGAMGKMCPGKPGKYEAVYGPLGKLSFTVK